jgi:hypothetical protein
MVQWGVLEDSSQSGHYVGITKRIAARGELAELLLEGLLIHEAMAVPIDQASRHPVFFPFELALRAQNLRLSEQFDVHRQGLDTDVVQLVR